ncbi:DUF6515 family protein [Flagellimonas beolgyonensis]|uniref:DUF6515 family protein n=2 Tax=Flavobacteriaceae TaxID=49546 RepID=UPI003D64BDA8
MKTKYIPVVAALILMGATVEAQEKTAQMPVTTKRALGTMPALVHGKPEQVIFGKVPLLETYHAMASNIPLEHNGQTYYYNDGNFFIFNGGRYLLVMPPNGMAIQTLPKSMEQVGNETFYVKGIFYKKGTKGYAVTKQPQGAIVYGLPYMTDVVTIGNEAYYEYLGVLYKRVFVQGEQAFEVVGELVQ